MAEDRNDKVAEQTAEHTSGEERPKSAGRSRSRRTGDAAGRQGERRSASDSSDGAPEQPQAAPSNAAADPQRQNTAADKQQNGRRSASSERRNASEQEGRQNGRQNANRGRERSVRTASRPASPRPEAPKRSTSSDGSRGGVSRRWRWNDYLIQLSVVILGVVVTFIGSGVVERWRQAREVRTVMHLVREELKTNRQAVDMLCMSLCDDRRGIALLQENGMDFKKLPTDTLIKYQGILGEISDHVPRTDALEMLRSMGASIDDKHLMLDVLECYSGLKELAFIVGIYREQKMQSLNHLFSNRELDASAIGDVDVATAWRMMMDDPMCSAFFANMGNFFDYGLINGGAVRRIDETVGRIDAKYGFR